MSAKVRYRVKKPGFINGSKIVPEPGKATYFEAEAGLKGSWFEPADRVADKPTPAASPATKT